jgi:hypothetical protein
MVRVSSFSCFKPERILDTDFKYRFCDSKYRFNDLPASVFYHTD